MKIKESVNGQQAKEIDFRYSSPGILYFNGIDNQIKIPYSPENNPNSFTIEMWVQFLGGAGYRAILTSVSRTAIYGRRGYVFCLNPVGQWQFWIGSGQMGTGWNIITGPKAKEGVWTHLAGTYDLKTQRMTFYVNGLVVGQITQIYFEPNHDHLLHIGAGATEQPGATECFFHGRIRDTRIVGEVLAPAEIQALAMNQEPSNSNTQEVGSTDSSNINLLSCDGRGDYVEIPYASSFNPSNFTVSCWVNIRGGQDKWRCAIASADDAPAKGYIVYAGENNRWQFWIGAGEEGWIKINGSDIALHTWTFLSASYDGHIMKLYVNGEVAAERLVKNYVVNTSRSLRIGAASTEGSPKYFLPGQITEVRVWECACTQKEIKNQMKERLVGDEPGLVGYWPLNEGVGATAWDFSANANDGRMPSYVEIPYASSLNLRQFTVSCWVNVQGWQGSWRSAIASSDDNPPKGYILYAGSDNRWQFCLGSVEGVWTTISGSEVRLNTRTFLAATYDGQTIKLYINGELVGEKTADYVVNLNRPLRIGAGSTEGNPDNFFSGQINQVGVWSHACTQEEIRNEMNSLMGGEAPGLVGYWSGAEGFSTTVIDKTSNGNHGTIKRATWEKSVGLILTSKTPQSGTKPPGNRLPKKPPAEPKPPESKQPEQPPAETKPPESKQPEQPPAETKPPESKQPEQPPAETKPPESKQQELPSSIGKGSGSKKPRKGSGGRKPGKPSREAKEPESTEPEGTSS